MKRFEKFEALSSEKKKSILNASMKEFIRGGYEKSSMNTIVETAGISKGSLFYYFENKKMLYLYLFEICEQMILDTAKEGIREEDKDFISRVQHNIKGNIALLRDYPLIYGFISSCKGESSIKVKSDIDILKEKNANQLFARLYKEIDHSLFRNEIDVDLSVYTIKTTMFQIVHDYLNNGEINNDDVLNKIDEVALFFKTALYK